MKGNFTRNRIWHHKGSAILFFCALIFVSCCSKQDSVAANDSPEGLPRQSNEYAPVVCDTVRQTPTAARKPSRSPLTPMVLVEGGSFAFSTGQEEGEEASIVNLPSFYIGKFEVTQAEWKRVMETNPSEYTGEDLPVDHVSWLEAVEFCNRLSEREHLAPAYVISPERVSWNVLADGYRLPTEAEWEFAACGGNNSQGYAYAGGNDLGQVAWCLDNSGRKSHPVGRKLPNELGLHDMSGNVWEWCWEWYDDSRSSHAIRGGSWYSFPIYGTDDCLPQGRYQYYEPETWQACIPVGIRLCRSQ